MRKFPDCFVCNDEGWVLYDEDESRLKRASFFSLEKQREAEPCPECNPKGEHLQILYP
jgi:hypothetical protein